MTQDEFIETVDGWPEELYRLAEVGVQCDDEEIALACQDYLNAKLALEELLSELEIELG